MSKKWVMILLILGILIVVGGIGGSMYLMWSKMSVLSEKLAVLAPEEETDEEGEGDEDGETKSIGITFPLDTFVVNLADEGTPRFLRISMSLEYPSDDFTEEVEGRIPQIKNAILMLLPSKTFAELNTMQGKVAVRDELKARMNSFFPEETITNIYFSEFVIQ